MNTITTVPKCNITIPRNWQYQTEEKPDDPQQVVINPQDSKANIRIDTNLNGKSKNSRIIKSVAGLILEVFKIPGDEGDERVRVDISKPKDGRNILLVRRYTRGKKDKLNISIFEQEKLTAPRKVPKRKRRDEKPLEQPPAEELTRVPRPYSYDL